MTMKTLDRPSAPSLFDPRVAMAVWALIGLVFLVAGAYAALSAPPTPARQLEILPDPDFHPFPVPAPVGPTPPEAELVASAR
ncbi:MAG TPA: hypothetical protein VF765_34370 [Polyangiaceae bacterium]